jgi:iron(III) transport system ATP-binding protein
LERPDSGLVFVGERLVEGMGRHEPPETRRVGLMFQDYALFPHLSAKDNVAFGLNRGPKAEREARARQELERVALAALADADPHTLSGGEQQRVALARAVVFQPKVLLFDEPLSNLDAKLRVEMREQIRALQKRIGITTVYVTHDQEEAMAISDRIAVMERGVVVQDGTAFDLYYRPRTEFVARFIGRTNLLAARVVSAADVEVEGLRIALATGRPVGDTIQLVVRPEMIDIAPTPSGGTMITQRTFLGEKTDYLVTLGSTTLQVSATDHYRRSPLEAGQPVTVHFHPEGIHVL